MDLTAIGLQVYLRPTLRHFYSTTSPQPRPPLMWGPDLSHTSSSPSAAPENTRCILVLHFCSTSSFSSSSAAINSVDPTSIAKGKMPFAAYANHFAVSLRGRWTCNQHRPVRKGGCPYVKNEGHLGLHEVFFLILSLAAAASCFSFSSFMLEG
jgi:hypothetical protein